MKLKLELIDFKFLMLLIISTYLPVHCSCSLQCVRVQGISCRRLSSYGLPRLIVVC